MSTTQTNNFVSYGDTGGLSQVYRTVNHITNFRGIDDNDKPIYASDVLPKVVFRGTVKLHGTNAAIGYDDGEIWFQSRSHRVGSGHYGFTDLPAEDITHLIACVKESYNLPYNSRFVVYGEWAGQGIQKTTAISRVVKRFYVFHVVLMVADHKSIDLCLSELMLDSTQFISCIDDYFVTTQIIDFSQDQKVVLEQLTPLIKGVEEECPVATSYGIKGIGEGIVFVGSLEGRRLCFKLKGDKHKVAKKEKLDIDPVKQANINNFAENFVTPERICQAVFELFPKTSDFISKKDTGAIVKWVRCDIMKEESETLAELGLAEGDIASPVSKLAARVFFDTFNLL